jgi:hypothetical protein
MACVNLRKSLRPDRLFFFFSRIPRSLHLPLPLHQHQLQRPRFKIAFLPTTTTTTTTTAAHRRFVNHLSASSDSTAIFHGDAVPHRKRVRVCARLV